MTQKKFKLAVSSHIPGLRLNIRDFESAYKKALQILQKENVISKKVKKGSVLLLFCDNKEITLLNAEYRGIKKPTDVISLSYPIEEIFPEKEDLLGEIMISVDTAKRQAKENGHSLKDELLFLFVHGILHIFGLDHEKPKERDRMFGLQDIILK
jgi:probable rRNA maturation factor